MDLTKEVQNRQSQLELIQQDLEAILGFYLPPELALKKKLRVISVGCGPLAPEVPAILELFPDAHYEGIDLFPYGEKQLKLLRNQYEDSLPPERFRMADATKRESFGESQWDLIIIRNPDVKKSIWEKIFENSLASLADSGIMLVTGHEESEMKMIKQLFESEFPDKVIARVGPQPIEIPFMSKYPMQESTIAVYQKVPPKS